MEKYPMTPKGFKKINEEFKKLKTVDRPNNVKAIEEARAHGDLSENAEFKYAKEQQSLIAGRLEYLEDRIARAQVIDPSTLSGDRVVFGAKVTFESVDDGVESVYRIIGEDESDIKNNTISITSPIARGLLKHEVGDEVKIRTPSGIRHIEIVDIEF